jgi:hypothetical protein
VEEEEMTAEELAALARRLGVPLREGSEAELAQAYERLQELAKRVRAAEAEPAHVFVPPE